MPFTVFASVEFYAYMCVCVYTTLTIPYGRIAITSLKGYGSLTVQLQESSWGLTGRKELTLSGPTPWVSLWPAALFSAGSSATCYTKSCGTDTSTWEHSCFCCSVVLILIHVVCEPMSVLLVVSPSQVLQDCMRHHSSLVEVGKLWVSQFTLL